MSRSWEKTAQELHVFARNQDHMYNSQMGIPIWFYIWKRRIVCFSTHNFTSFKLGRRIWPEVEKKHPKNYTSALTIKTLCTTVKWVSTYNFIFGNEEFFVFQPIIPLRSNLGLEYDPKLRNNGPLFLNRQFFAFKTIIPLRSNLGLEFDLELRKKRPINYTSSLAIKTTCTTLKWVSKYDFIFGNKEFLAFQPIIPLRSNLGPEYKRKLRKNGPRTTHLCSQSRPCVQLPNGYPNMISYFEMENLFLFNS